MGTNARQRLPAENKCAEVSKLGAESARDAFFRPCGKKRRRVSTAADRHETALHPVARAAHSAYTWCARAPHKAVKKKRIICMARCGLQVQFCFAPVQKRRCRSLQIARCPITKNTRRPPSLYKLTLALTQLATRAAPHQPLTTLLHSKRFPPPPQRPIAYNLLPQSSPCLARLCSQHCRFYPAPKVSLFVPLSRVKSFYRS